MKNLNFNTEKAQNFINAYKRSNKRRLEQIYTRWSMSKQLAYDYCKKCYSEDENSIANSFKIISHNTNFFTIAWLSGTGLRVETATNSYKIEIPF